jgi:tRNA threonylcarbamoyl adenosine modification protein (Sua5/YciO/YrdC/YwlC family)
MTANVLRIHPTHPQRRLINQVVTALQGGGVVSYPTDSCYAFGCMVGDKAAQDRIRALRAVDDDHRFTLLCKDLSDLGTYAKVDNPAYRLIRSLTPGPYTFLLRASKEVPRRLRNPRRKTVGLRIPQHPIVRALLSELGEPIMSTTVLLRGDEEPLNDALAIKERAGHALELIVDGGPCGTEPTTVIDLSTDSPVIVRAGKGSIDDFIEYVA